MEKKNTIVHFLCAVALICFAVILFKIANGSISMNRIQNEDGSFEPGGLLPLMLGFNACIIGLGGLITILQEGEFVEWVKSCGVILGFALVGFMFDITSITELLIGGIYAVWWAIASIRSLIESWGENGFTLSRIIAVCRILTALALISFIPVWIFVPSSYLPVDNMRSIIAICNVSGILTLLSAVGAITEGIIWLKCIEN